MADQNVSDTLPKEPPTVKLQIGVNGYRMVLCFSEVEPAQQYFTSVRQNTTLSPRISDNDLEVSLDLRKARKIILGKGPGGPFKIQFRTYWSAKKWHHLSNLAHLYSRKGRCVLIAEPGTHLVGLLPMHVLEYVPPFSSMVPSPPTRVDIVIRKAESLLIRRESALSKVP